MKKSFFAFIIALFIFMPDCFAEQTGDNFFESFMKQETSSKGFLKALDQRKFIFPQDHGVHKGFQTQWWYFTGNLSTVSGRRFGYQFTIFRSQLNPLEKPLKSSFSSNAVFMVHFTVTDIKENRFYFFEKFARENENNAFVKNMPFNANIDGWQLVENDDDFTKLENLRLTAGEDNISLDLNLKFLKPFVLQGNNGLSIKGSGKGNASYYYSETRIESKGVIKIGNESFDISGFSWLDREWSTSALSDDQTGWDWFSMQLNDFTEIMFYNLRLKNGKTDPLSQGVFVFKNGSYIKLLSEDVVLKPLDKWLSPKGGVYPSGWNLKVSKLDLDLNITPFSKNQELDFFIRYWEGAVFIEGFSKGQKVKGSGYVELTGYDKSL